MSGFGGRKITSHKDVARQQYFLFRVVKDDVIIAVTGRGNYLQFAGRDIESVLPNRQNGCVKFGGCPMIAARAPTEVF